MFLIEDSSWEPIKETDKQQFCVEIMKRLDIQRKKGQFCDVVLEVCNGEDQARFNAHRVVLCAGSPFFYSALNNDMKESKEGLIRLEDMSKVAIEELLDYLYTGHVDVTQHNAFDLLKIADFLVIPSLKDVSSKFIIQSLSSSNCFMAYYLAVNYRCFELQEKARDFIYANFTRVVEHEDFLNLTINEVEEWISSDEIRVRGEEDVFEAIVKWVEQKGSGEREKFFELFRHVRLIYLSRNYVLNDILPHPLITNEKACTAFVLDTIKHVSCGSEECFFAQAPRNCLKTAEDCLVVSGVTKTLCYVAHEDKWYQMADKAKSRYLYSASAYHGKLYINHGTGVDYAIERFDPAVNSWAPLTSYSGEMSHYFAAVVYFQGFLYVIGGKQNGEVANCVHKYSPDTNLWQEVAAMNVSRFSPRAVADEDTIYAIGGQKNDQILDVVERFDSKMNSWCRVASMLEKKLLPCVAILNARVFLFGGFTSISPLDVCSRIEMYDPTSNMWTAIQGISAPTRFFSVTSFKGSVYVIGNWTQESPGSFLRIYDVEKNEWKHCSSVPEISSPIALAPLRIPRDILKTCNVVT